MIRISKEFENTQEVDYMTHQFESSHNQFAATSGSGERSHFIKGQNEDTSEVAKNNSEEEYSIDSYQADEVSSTDGACYFYQGFEESSEARRYQLLHNPFIVSHRTPTRF